MVKMCEKRLLSSSHNDLVPTTIAASSSALNTRYSLAQRQTKSQGQAPHSTISRQFVSEAHSTSVCRSLILAACWLYISVHVHESIQNLNAYLKIKE
jgi:hypothetical protein